MIHKLKYIVYKLNLHRFFKRFYMLSSKICKHIIKLSTFFIIIPSWRKKAKKFLKKDIFKIPYRRQKEFYDYVLKYCQISSNFTNQSFNQKPLSTLPIWQIWFQGEEYAPKLVKKCFQSIEKYAGDRPIIRLTDETISQYIDLPDFIWEKYQKGNITKTHFSDIIRVCLLSKYGGTWVDATVFFTDKIPEEILQSSFFGYHVTTSSSWFDCHEFLGSASWFLHAKPNNCLMIALRDALFKYWERENELVDYFLIYFLFKGLIDQNIILMNEWKNTFFLEEEPTHRLQLAFHQKFDQNKLNHIKNCSTVHKLSYKFKTIEKDSFLDIFLRNTEIFL